MSGDDFRAPAMSWDQIRADAISIRESLGLSDVAYVPIVDIIERILDVRLGMVRFEVETKKVMGQAEGFTCPKGEFIMLREDVYEKACDGDGRARFTAAHELGHFLLHTNVPLARCERGDGTPAYRLAEPQANQFAAEFLMPDSLIDSFDEAPDLMDRFGVSYGAAGNRLDYLLRKGRI